MIFRPKKDNVYYMIGGYPKERYVFTPAYQQAMDEGKIEFIYDPDRKNHWDSSVLRTETRLTYKAIMKSIEEFGRPQFINEDGTLTYRTLGIMW